MENSKKLEGSFLGTSHSSKKYWALLRKPIRELTANKDVKLESYSGQRYIYLKCEDKDAVAVFFDYNVGDEPSNIKIIRDETHRDEIRYIIGFTLLHIRNKISLDELRKDWGYQEFTFEVVDSSEERSKGDDFQHLIKQVETIISKQI